MALLPPAYQILVLDSFISTIPVRIRAAATNLIGFTASFSQRIPTENAPIAPMPVQTV
jgi:hypothetical protein